MKRWVDLRPEAGMVAALDETGPRPTLDAGRQPKHGWSNAFADQCALMIANALRREGAMHGRNVYPTENLEKAEYVTAAGARGKGKRVDVSVSTEVAGLQLALSLKAGNFVDPGSGYGKNLTGRLYELLDETKAVHEYHPHSTIVAVYFLPLAATMDKVKKSTFARAVAMLRAHTGRDDPLQVTQFDRFDWSAIGLYVPEDDTTGCARGVCRFFDTHEAPPIMGRPKVPTTMSLTEFVSRVVHLYRSGRVHDIEYAEPEPDADAPSP